MGVGVIVLEGCGEDMEGSALCDVCNDLSVCSPWRRSNRQHRDLFCPTSSSYPSEGSGRFSQEVMGVVVVFVLVILSYGRYPAL